MQYGLMKVNIVKPSKIEKILDVCNGDDKALLEAAGRAVSDSIVELETMLERYAQIEVKIHNLKYN